MSIEKDPRRKQGKQHGGVQRCLRPVWKRKHFPLGRSGGWKEGCLNSGNKMTGNAFRSWSHINISSYLDLVIPPVSRVHRPRRHHAMKSSQSSLLSSPSSSTSPGSLSLSPSSSSSSQLPSSSFPSSFVYPTNSSKIPMSDKRRGTNCKSIFSKF